MNSYLRQATAAQSRAIGPFVNDTDFKTPETALTIANTDIKLVINGAASADKNSGGGTHRINGVYGVTFDATDTATVGEIDVSVVVAGALPVFHKFFVLEEAVYDQLFVATAPGAPTAAQINTEADTALSDVLLDKLMKNAATLSAVHDDSLMSQLMTKTVIDNWDRTTMSLEDAFIDAIDAAGIRSAIGLASANLDTQLTAIDDLLDTEVGAIKTKTDFLPSVTAGAAGGLFIAGSNAATSITTALTANVTGNLSGSVGSVAAGGIAAASFAAGAIDAAAIAADAIGSSELAAGACTEIADAILARTLGTEGYAADGAVPTLAQAIFMLLSKSFEMSISGTTLTCKKLDGATSSMTFTLNDATTPTAITRAT